MLAIIADMLGIDLLSTKDGVFSWSILTKDAVHSLERYVVYGSNLEPAIVENYG